MSEVRLSDGSICKVDEEDLESVSKHSWCPSRNGGNQIYAQTRSRGKTLYMHRLIMRAPKGAMIDHANGDPLDNRKENLRFVTRSQNGLNSRARARVYSKHRGVTFDLDRGKWMAQLVVNKKRVLRSRFDSEEEASAAYRCAVETYCRGFVP